MKFYRSTWYLLVISAIVLINENAADSSENAINELYENLLQREYTGPINFPNHQVERKAQRSPSLRLRFGRSDPNQIQTLEKRWFGDVNQKPIRSPSLRLRFGRRSDPSVPLQDIENFNDYSDYEFYRPMRKPARLRWGRSAPNAKDDIIILDNADDIIPTEIDRNVEINVPSEESIRMLLNAFKELNDNKMSSGELRYNREIRKTGPLRLRWGRSTEHLEPATPKKEDLISKSDISVNAPASNLAKY